MKTKIAAICVAVFGFVSFVITLPPELQGPIFAQLIAICPPQWQSTVGGLCKLISLFSVTFALFLLRNKHDNPPPTT